VGIEALALVPGAVIDYPAVSKHAVAIKDQQLYFFPAQQGLGWLGKFVETHAVLQFGFFPVSLSEQAN
jgi:hypothetical protein